MIGREEGTKKGKGKGEMERGKESVKEKNKGFREEVARTMSGYRN